MAEAQFAYSWQPPKYRKHQRVRFFFREGLARDGVVMQVETYYRATGEAWHIYSVRADGHAQHRHVGDDDVICAL